MELDTLPINYHHYYNVSFVSNEMDEKCITFKMQNY